MSEPIKDFCFIDAQTGTGKYVINGSNPMVYIEALYKVREDYSLHTKEAQRYLSRLTLCQ